RAILAQTRQRSVASQAADLVLRRADVGERPAQHPRGERGWLRRLFPREVGRAAAPAHHLPAGAQGANPVARDRELGRIAYADRALRPLRGLSGAGPELSNIIGAPAPHRAGPVRGAREAVAEGEALHIAHIRHLAPRLIFIRAASHSAV